MQIIANVRLFHHFSFKLSYRRFPLSFNISSINFRFLFKMSLFCRILLLSYHFYKQYTQHNVQNNVKQYVILRKNMHYNFTFTNKLFINSYLCLILSIYENYSVFLFPTGRCTHSICKLIVCDAIL